MLVINDDLVGTHIRAELPSGYIGIDKIDLDSSSFVLNEAAFFDPDIRIYQKPPSSLKDSLLNTRISTESSAENDFSLGISDLVLRRGRLIRKNFKADNSRLPVEGAINFNDLLASSIDMEFKDLLWKDNELSGSLSGMSFKEKNGFELTRLMSKEIEVRERRIGLYGMKLETPNSTIGDTIVFKFRGFESFRNFSDKVIMDHHFDAAQVSIKDILQFVPPLNQNAFFSQNIDQRIQIDGYISGKVNSLKGKDLALKIGNGLLFEGKFSSRNLTVRGEEALNLKVDGLKTDIQTLRLLIPNFDPPSNFDKLGNINFTGRFDGFFVDFVAYGKLITELGVASTDLRLDLRKGRDLASYSGELNLEQFDLRTWSGNNELGIISFASKLEQGQGLTLQTVNAALTAEVSDFSFRGYNYSNIILDGLLDKNHFDGNLSLNDPNANFVFEGTIDVDSLPGYDFTASVNTLNLQALKITKYPLKLAGYIDIMLTGRKVEDMQGKLDFRSLTINKDSTLFELDSLNVMAENLPGGRKRLSLASDLVTGLVEGNYVIQRVPDVLAAFVKDHYPTMSKRLGIRDIKPLNLEEYGFTFDLNIKDSKNALELVNTDLDTIKDLSLKGAYDGLANTLYFDLKAPKLAINKVSLDDVQLNWDGKGEKSEISLGIYHTSIGNLDIQTVNLESELIGDTLRFDLSNSDFKSEIDKIHLAGDLVFVEEYTDFSFNPENLILLSKKWSIDPENYLRVGPKYIETKDFVLERKEKTIAMATRDGKGLLIDVEGFEFGLIDSFWVYNEMDFSKPFSAQLVVEDLFRLKGISLDLTADTLQVNQDDWGGMILKLTADDNKSPILADLHLLRDTQELSAEGIIGHPGIPMDKRPKYDVDISAQIANYPLNIAEYWIGNGVTDTRGQFDANARFWIEDKVPHIDGLVDVSNLETTINYLQTRYYANSGVMQVNDEYLFDASDNIIQDELGNTAELKGGIIHKQFKNLGLDASIESDRFLALDTKKEDNPLFYGTCEVGGTIDFTGTFQRTNISVDARSIPGSKLFIPLEDQRDATAISFINLIPKEEYVASTEDRVADPRGVDFRMDLQVENRSEVQLIFDERARDIIKGRGTGDLQMHFQRNGDFSMFGNYTISQGEYFYTYQTIVNKEFIVQPGGTIVWSGSPYEADINLDASYSGLSSPLTNLLTEYVISNDQLASQARNATDILLLMELEGKLSRPDINFDIEFPDLQGDIKSITESKINVLKTDQNELNRQVFALIFFGTFIPTEELGTQAFQAIDNTVSELLTTQLSYYITQLLSDVVLSKGLIEGIDFDIRYNSFDNSSTPSANDNLGQGRELGFDISVALNDRWSINGGLDLDWYDQGGGPASAGAGSRNSFLGGEVVVEYAITPNRQFNVKMYFLQDQTTFSTQNKRGGVGINYRKEFDSLKEFFNGLKKDARGFIDSSDRGIQGTR